MAEITSIDYSKRNLEAIPFNIINVKINWLIISDNKIKEIPDAIQNLTALTRIAANDNRIRHISPMIIRLKELNWIDLTRNRLRELPEGFHTLQKVTGLGLSENDFEKIPECIFKMTNIKKFGFFSNRVKYIPPDIKYLKNLVKIDLSNNQLSSLPEEFCELTNLNWLNLSNNKLKKLPANMNKLVNLEELGLGMNQLEEIPDIGNLHRLRILPVFKNKIKKVSTSLAGLKSIEKLDFSDNAITEFPTQILEIPTLRYLNLKSNKIKMIHAGLVDGIKSKITMLDLSDNLLPHIPLKFFKIFPNISTIRINDNPYVYSKNKIPPQPSLLEMCYSKCLNTRYNAPPWITNVFKKVMVCDVCDKYYVKSPYVVYCLSSINEGFTFVVEKMVCSSKCYKAETK